MARHFSTELADYPKADRLTLELIQRLKKLGKTDKVDEMDTPDTLDTHSVYQFVKVYLLQHVLDLFLSGKLYGGHVDETMRRCGYDVWTDEDVIAQAVVDCIYDWSSSDLNVSLR